MLAKLCETGPSDLAASGKAGSIFGYASRITIGELLMYWQPPVLPPKLPTKNQRTQCQRSQIRSQEGLHVHVTFDIQLGRNLTEYESLNTCIAAAGGIRGFFT